MKMANVKTAKYQHIGIASCYHVDISIQLNASLQRPHSIASLAVGQS